MIEIWIGFVYVGILYSFKETKNGGVEICHEKKRRRNHQSTYGIGNRRKETSRKKCLNVVEVDIQDKGVQEMRMEVICSRSDE